MAFSNRIVMKITGNLIPFPPGLNWKMTEKIEMFSFFLNWKQNKIHYQTGAWNLVCVYILVQTALNLESWL